MAVPAACNEPMSTHSNRRGRSTHYLLFHEFIRYIGGIVPQLGVLLAPNFPSGSREPVRYVSDCSQTELSVYNVAETKEGQLTGRNHVDEVSPRFQGLREPLDGSFHDAHEGVAVILDGVPVSYH